MNLEQSAESPSARLPLIGLVTLSSAAFLTIATEASPAGVLLEMSADLGVSESTLGLLVTGFALTAGLTSIPVTAATRGVPRRMLLLILLATFGVVNAVTAVSDSFALTFAFRVVGGVVTGLMWAMVVGYADRMVAPQHRGKALAIVLAGSAAALSLGLPASAALGAWLGWRVTFGVLTALMGVLIVLTLLNLPRFPGEPPEERTPLMDVIRTPGFVVVAIVGLLIPLAHNVLYTYIAPFVALAGLGGAVGLVLFAFGVGAVAGVSVAGALVDRRLRTTLLGGLGVLTIALIVLGLAGQSPAVVFVAVFLWGVVFGGAPTLTQTAAVQSVPTAPDVVTAIMITTFSVGVAAGSLIGGTVLDGAGADGLPWAALGFVALALVMVAAGRRHSFASHGAGGSEPPQPAPLVPAVATACTSGD